MRSDACWLLLLGVRTHGSQQKASPQLDQLITPGGSLRMHAELYTAANPRC